MTSQAFETAKTCFAAQEANLAMLIAELERRKPRFIIRRVPREIGQEEFREFLSERYGNDGLKIFTRLSSRNLNLSICVYVVEASEEIGKTLEKLRTVNVNFYALPIKRYFIYSYACGKYNHLAKNCFSKNVKTSQNAGVNRVVANAAWQNSQRNGRVTRQPEDTNKMNDILMFGRTFISKNLRRHTSAWNDRN